MFMAIDTFIFDTILIPYVYLCIPIGIYSNRENIDCNCPLPSYRSTRYTFTNPWLNSHSQLNPFKLKPLKPVQVIATFDLISTENQDRAFSRVSIDVFLLFQEFPMMFSCLFKSFQCCFLAFSRVSSPMLCRQSSVVDGARCFHNEHP